MQRDVLAHTELPGDYRRRMALNMLCSSLGHVPLQKHLLAVHTHTLESAVHARN